MAFGYLIMKFCVKMESVKKNIKTTVYPQIKS